MGKTQLVEQFARDRDLDFVYLAPAQFEEMGDLIGLPVVEHGRTAYRPPVWAPPAWCGPSWSASGCPSRSLAVKGRR